MLFCGLINGLWSSAAGYSDSPGHGAALCGVGTLWSASRIAAANISAISAIQTHFVPSDIWRLL